MKKSTKYDHDKLFMAYEECRADNTAHIRKILELQKENEKLEELLSKANSALRNVENLSHRIPELRGFHPFEIPAKETK